MSDGRLLPTVLSSPKNSGHQQVTAPKLLFLTDEKPTTVSNEENSNDSSTKLTNSATKDMNLLKESPIAKGPDSTKEELIMSPELAQEFANVEKLPGYPSCKTRCTIDQNQNASSFYNIPPFVWSKR